MNIIDKKGLLSPQWVQLIQTTANKAYKLESFNKIEDIHTCERVDVIIEDKKNGLADFQKDIIEKLMTEYSNPDTSAERKHEIGDKIDKICLIPILGEYKPQEHNIYLYIGTINNVSGGINVGEFILTTYVHEMMHAYFDRRGHKQYPYIYDIEESLAEAGMLLFLHKTQSSVLPWAINNVKQKSPNLPEYARGADLYDDWKKYSTDLEKWIRDYKNHNVISRSNVLRICTMRDHFEDWLLNNGYSSLSAAYNACYMPLLGPIKDVVSSVTSGQTDYLLDIVSNSCLGQVLGNIHNFSFIRSYQSCKKYESFIKLYIRYLNSTNQMLP